MFFNFHRHHDVDSCFLTLIVIMMTFIYVLTFIAIIVDHDDVAAKQFQRCLALVMGGVHTQVSDSQLRTTIMMMIMNFKGKITPQRRI